jgi:oligopeptide transport system ATP-binding protein
MEEAMLSLISRAKFKMTRYAAKKRCIEMLTLVGITNPEKRMKQYPFEFSGGMLQRVMIAMALLERSGSFDRR